MSVESYEGLVEKPFKGSGVGLSEDELVAGASKVLLDEREEVERAVEHTGQVRDGLRAQLELPQAQVHVSERFLHLVLLRLVLLKTYVHTSQLSGACTTYCESEQLKKR